MAADDYFAHIYRSSYWGQGETMRRHFGQRGTAGLPAARKHVASETLVH